jgi:hypothetical protein
VEPDGVDDEDPVVEDVAKAGEHNQPFPKHPFALYYFLIKIIKNNK